MVAPKEKTPMRKIMIMIILMVMGELKMQLKGSLKTIFTKVEFQWTLRSKMMKNSKI
jgi:hypothetical protein